MSVTDELLRNNESYAKSFTKGDLAELIEDRRGRSVNRTPRELETKRARGAPLRASDRRLQVAELQQKERGHLARGRVQLGGF